MDMRKRLKRQGQVTSLRARRLNQNAEALLLRQLVVLEKRQALTSRHLARGQNALLLETLSAQPPEHHDRGDNLRNPVLQLPPLDSGDMQRDTTQLLDDQSPCLYHKSSENHPKDFKNKTLKWQTGSLGGQLSRQLSLCRFSDLSEFPCCHFPCARPNSYNSFTGRHNNLASKTNASLHKNHFFPDFFPDLPASDPSLVSMGVDSGKLQLRGARPHNTQGSHPSSKREMSRDENDVDTHRASPRTSIPERLRVLCRLVHEMRTKNEAKRPCDRSVNYGLPLSRRLLRKPVVPTTLD